MREAIKAYERPGEAIRLMSTSREDALESEMEGDGGRWREMEGDGGRGREMEGDGGRRREMEGDGGRRREDALESEFVWIWSSSSRTRPRND